MPDPPEFRVYLSSTIEDLIEERVAAIEILRRHALVKDSYRASEEGTIATCSQDVRESHLYVGIIGQRYGWIPDGEDNVNGKSITEIEYETCRETGRPRIPRLIFIRTTNPDKFTDAHTRPKTAERIRKFRQRATDIQEQQAFQFATIDEFRIALSEAVMRQRDAFHRERAPGQPIFDTRKIWHSVLRPIGLLSVPGTDDLLCDLIVRTKPELFYNTELSPTSPLFSLKLDQGVQRGQLCCLLVTPSSLTRMSEANVSPRFAYAIRTMQRRIGSACILCVDVNPAHLPDAWKPVTVISTASISLKETTTATVEKISTDLRAQATLTLQPRLALPCLIIAPTHAEVQALVHVDGSGFSDFEDDNFKNQMREQFEKLTQAAQAIHPNWPAGMYDGHRERWRCFGSTSSTVSELIKDVVSAINTSMRGSRERELLQDAEIEVRHYDLDEYLQDYEGSRLMIEAVRDRGSLIVIDETALLHPSLRKACNVLLSAPRCAIVSISPCDPAHMPTRLMLSESSFLRVGAIVDRFRTQQDPQCELALNSEERVRRWLRMAIPRLVVESDGMMGRPRLSSKADQLFD